MVNEKRGKYYKVIWIAVVIALCLGCTVWIISNTHILHRVSKTISPDGTIKYQIYDCTLSEKSQSKGKDIITVREYNLTEDKNEWKLVSETELAGVYQADYWSEDSNMFVIQVDDETESLYLFNSQDIYMRRLDNFLDMQLISAASFNSRLYRYLLSEGEKINYEFDQWADNGDVILIRYTVDEKQVDEGTNKEVQLSGYFWYDILRNSIKGLVETNK